MVTGLADTASKARGFDIAARQGNRHRVVEVKGFPSKDYADPRRAGEQKKDEPAQSGTEVVCAGDPQSDADSKLPPNG